MDITQYKNKFTIQKVVPSRNLWSELKRFGLNPVQIISLMGRYEMNDLRGLLEQVKKIQFENHPALLMKMARGLPKKKRKPRQMKIKGLWKTKTK